jgi:hypothetical protein
MFPFADIFQRHQTLNLRREEGRERDPHPLACRDNRVLRRSKGNLSFLLTTGDLDGEVETAERLGNISARNPADRDLTRVAVR